MSHTHTIIRNFGFIELLSLPVCSLALSLSLSRPFGSGALGEVTLVETAARTAKRGRSLSHTYRHSHTYTREARILLTATDFFLFNCREFYPAYREPIIHNVTWHPYACVMSGVNGVKLNLSGRVCNIGCQLGNPTGFVVDQLCTLH